MTPQHELDELRQDMLQQQYEDEQYEYLLRTDYGALSEKIKEDSGIEEAIELVRNMIATYDYELSVKDFLENEGLL